MKTPIIIMLLSMLIYADHITDSLAQSWKNGSIMYEDEKMSWIQDAIKSHEKNIPLEILLPKLFPPTPTVEEIERQEVIEETPVEEVVQIELPKEAPAFYLKSILYISESNWTIWLNNRRISSNDKYENPRIIKVTPNNVILLWQDTQIDYIMPEWRTSFTPLSDSNRYSNNKNIVINPTNGEVSFILSPNQSLVTKTMQIVEGKALAEPMPQNNEPSTSDPENAPNEEEIAEPVQEQIQTKKPMNNIPLTIDKNGDNKHMQQYLQQLNTLQSVFDNQ